MIFLRGKFNRELTFKAELPEAFKYRGSVCIYPFYTFRVNNNNNKWKGQTTEIYKKIFTSYDK